MVEYETKKSNGESPVEQLQEFKEHANNVKELEQLATEVDGLADTMKASYNQETKLGKLTLFLEFYDEE